MNQRIFPQTVVHHGLNIKRLREILNVKQDVLAAEFNFTQQAISELEKKAQISDEILEKVAGIMKIPIKAIKNFDEKIVVNAIIDTFTE
jgi:transcriptional regulator with XRE-family HTH domain